MVTSINAKGSFFLGFEGLALFTFSLLSILEVAFKSGVFSSLFDDRDGGDLSLRVLNTMEGCNGDKGTCCCRR